MSKFDSFSSHLQEALNERGVSPERVETMRPIEVFTEFCEWHGLINWGGTLYQLVENIKSVYEEEER